MKKHSESNVERARRCINVCVHVVGNNSRTVPVTGANSKRDIQDFEVNFA